MPAGKAVHHVEPLAGVEVIDGTLAVHLEAVLVHREIHRPPPHVVFRGGMFDHALVLRRAAGLCAGVSAQRAGVGDGGPRLVADGVLVENGVREVAVDVFDGDAVGREVEAVDAGAHG